MTRPEQGTEPDTVSEEAAASTGRRFPWGTVLKIVFTAAVVGFGVYYIGSRWSALVAAMEHAHPFWVVLAVVFGAAGLWLAMLGFGVTLQAAAPGHLPYQQVSRVYFVSQLGKYLPGAVWPIVAVTSMGSRFGITRRGSATAASLALLISIVGGGMVGAVLTVVGAAGRVPALWWLLLVPLVCIAFLRPRFILPIVDRIMRLLRRDPVDLKLTGGVLARAAGWNSLSWIVMGLQCWSLVVAFGGDMWSSLAASVGGFALAYTVGTLFIPAPGGLGVREAVLNLVLGGIIASGSAFTADSVVVVVLVSRVLLALLDFLMAGVAVLLARASDAGATAKE